VIADLEAAKRSSAFEQESALEDFEEAEATIVSLQEKLAEAVKASSAELEACQERERALAVRCTELETQVGDKEECLVELERSLSVMRATAETSEGTSSAAEEALQVAEDARDAAIAALATAENDLLKAMEDAEVHVTERLALEEALVAKDKVIADFDSERASIHETQEIDFESSEAIIISMQEKLDASLEAVKVSSAELEAYQERERALTARCTELETQVGDKEECLAELERSLSVMRATAETSEGTSRAAEEALQVAEDARDAAIAALATAENDLLKAMEDAEVYVTERLALEEALVAKDKVIEDLESERSAVESEKLSLVSDLDRLNAELALTATERDAINVELEKTYRCFN
jgi:hypothetical protein